MNINDLFSLCNENWPFLSEGLFSCWLCFFLREGAFRCDKMEPELLCSMMAGFGISSQWDGALRITTTHLTQAPCRSTCCMPLPTPYQLFAPERTAQWDFFRASGQKWGRARDGKIAHIGFWPRNTQRLHVLFPVSPVEKNGSTLSPLTSVSNQVKLFLLSSGIATCT